jgi:hypothetical protein
MIPDKNLFIITSAVKPVMGAFSHEERFQQTVDSLISLQKNTKDSILMLVDVSVASPLTDEEKKILSDNCHIFIDVSDIPLVRDLSAGAHKSHAENALIYNVLMNLKYDIQMQKIMQPVKRIFKYSSRTTITEDFNLSDYDNLFGKFVFKKRIPTWMQPIQGDATHLLITRMFSFCPSLIDTYIDVIRKNFEILNYVDTEHAHFVNIPKEYLVEFDTIGCEGFLAGNRTIERY